MKRLASVMLVILLASPAVCVGAEMFRFELMDGTIIDGTINKLEQLTVKTAYGTLRIPIAELAGFSPGLDSRPELAEKVDVLIRLLVSPEKAERETAQAELIKLGPALRLIIEKLAKDEDPDPERKARIKAILDAYKAWPAKHPNARQPFVLPREQKDKVATADLSAAGRIANEQFTVAAPYGKLTIKLGDIYRARKVKTRQPRTAKSQAISVIVRLRDGSVLKGGTTLASISLTTPYGKMVAPLHLVRGVTMQPGKNVAIVRLRNGDRLVGTVDLGAKLDVNAAFGKVSVPLKQVARFRVTGVPDLLDGLVAYWRGDGNARDSVGGHHGKAVRAGYAADRHGRANRAFHFDGTSRYIDIPDHAALDTDEAFTLAAWVKPKSFRDKRGEKSVTIVCKWYGSSRDGDYMLRLREPGTLLFNASERHGRMVEEKLFSKSLLPKNKWSHVVATFDRGKIKLYINGRLDVSKKSDRIRRTSLREYRYDNVNIGSLGWYGRYNFDGAIDDVGIWNRALSGLEVEQLYREGVALGE